ncbi:hypothetical protein J4Q44_G00009760 [Coregonus suidteri]|uniref:Uncharacterized protein n=1 Tax=Coregonus suidteri TaxID=861788 RepID=A0AAN8R9C3_9TELE
MSPGPLCSDPAQQRMLGNSKHYYPGEDDKYGEDEEEEEEQGRENRKGESREKENGGIEGLEEMEIKGGRQSRDGKWEGSKPSAIVVGRQRGDRTLRLANPRNRGIPYTSNQAPHKQQHHLIPANQQQYHPAPSTQTQKRRAHMERSMTTVAPIEDTHLTMMVFRIGIPDIKQTSFNEFEEGVNTKRAFGVLVLEHRHSRGILDRPLPTPQPNKQLTVPRTGNIIVQN